MMRSYFGKFMLYFSIILVIPLLTIIFVYITAEHTVKKQILFASESTLTQFFNALDLRLEEMKGVCLSIISDEAIENYARSVVYTPESSSYSAYLAKEKLNVISGSKYHDVFVYYTYEDKMVSGMHSSLQSSLYYAAYYEKQGIPRAHFENVLQSEAGGPRLFCWNGADTTENYLGIAMQQYGFRDSRMNYMAGVLLYPEYLEQMLSGSFSEENQGNILLLDRDMELIASSTLLDYDIDIEQLEFNSKSQEITLGTERYMINIQKSGALEAYYASVVPLDYFWRQISSLRLICGISIILCIAVSLILAYLLTNRAYTPIGSILSKIQSVSDERFDKESKNEFQYISEVFQKSMDEKKLLDRKMRLQKDSARDGFLLSIMQGQELSEQKADDIFNEYGIQLISDMFAVLLLQLDTIKGGQTGAAPSVDDVKLLSMVFENVFTEILEEEHRVYLVSVSADSYALLINCAGNENIQEQQIQNEMIERCLAGKQFVEKNFQVVCTASLSNIHNGLLGMSIAYEEAIEALKYRFMEGRGSFITFENVSKRSFRYMATSDSKAAQMLIAFVEGNIKDKPAAQVVSDILDTQEISSEDSMGTVECFRMDMVNAVSKMILAHFAPGQAKGNTIRELLYAETLEEFREKLEACMIWLRSQQEGREAKDSIAKRTREYIHKHYDDTQISVAALGDAMDLSSWYLSKMFKEQYNITIPDYINKVRLIEAKKLLCSSTMNISEIAERVGFSGSSVFIKTFKRADGITPGVYRMMIRKQEKK